MALTLATSGPLLQSDPYNLSPASLPLEIATCVPLMGFSLAAGWAATPSKTPFIPDIPFLEGVAPTNRIITSDCGDECMFTSPLVDSYFLDMEIGIEKARLGEWIADMESIIRKDLDELPGLLSPKRCLPPGSFVIRFGQPNDYHLAMASGMKEPVYLQYLFQDFRGSAEPMRYIWIEEAYEQLTLIKYNGRPHWGKNLERTFTDARSPIADKYPGGVAAMAALQEAYDPDRVFEPALWAKITAREAFKPSAGCATRYECYCSANSHCAHGWRCVPSRAFPEYKVCKPRTLV
ncbi:MAG: hypothetical protein J3K34DRAFT_251663 [Monoraphidium minutum]|nr:MAG: hypothetical protein J3K34DRAFT_251663 [Monoraphidium minutum]